MRVGRLFVATLLLWASACSTKEKTSARREPDEDVMLPPPPKASATARPAASTSELPSGPLTFGKDEAAAVKKARSERRPMVIDFSAMWCAACKELDKHVFSNREVLTEGGRFVGLRIDATDDEDPAVLQLMKKYKVFGLPAVILIDSNGIEKKRIDRFIPAEEFLAAMKDVK